jgi:type I restriction enzyme M protein
MVGSLSFVSNEDTQKLYNHLYQGCNILRGPIYPEEYKTYIFPLLFYKRLCDEYTRETDIALEESDGDVQYALFPENHRFIVPEGSHWNDIRVKSENIGFALQTAFRNIERANPKSLITIFNDFDDAKWSNKERLTDDRLKDLLEHFSSLNLDDSHCPDDVLGQAYEYLVKKFADLTNKKAGEFYTPRSIVSLLVRIIDPQPGETIYDPACGTGGMLIESRRHINDDTACLGKIFGQEKNLSTSAIARMNLYLHGANDFSILRGDTLRNPAYIFRDKLRTFDCVISNPPFSLENWGSEAWESDKYGRNFLGIPPSSSGDFAWIEHMIKSMNPLKGRIAVVLPQGVLFRAGQEGKIRESLLEMDLLDAIIGLAPNLFYGTGLSACVLILKAKKSPERKGQIMFVDASSIYKKGRAHNEMLVDHVEYIYELATGNDDVKGLCRLVPIGKIIANGCNLNISRYVEIVREENTMSLSEALRKLKQSVNEAHIAENRLKELLCREGLLGG